MSLPRVLVVGASGAVGRELLQQLLALPSPPQIRVSTRNTAAAKGDLSDISSYHRLFAGVDRAFLYSTPEAPLGQLFTAAKDEGVQHVTLLSSLSVEDDPDGMIGTAQRKVENAIVNADLLYTFIRAGNFCSNTSLFWLPQIENVGRLWMAYPDAQSAPVSESDIASVAVIALTTDQLVNQAIPVTGPGWISHREQMRTINRARQMDGKQPIEFLIVSPEDWKSRTSDFIPEDLQNQLLRFWALGEQKKLAFQPSESVTGKPSQCFEDWLAYNKAAFLRC
ncbi:hypothetical protein ASPVEDRAFT_84465 [Aspergillus versicolor CBS 583.65]|uniref:NAD(P)-binding domain-containing protein n=1 Tax=Aspergillus versicolor CBS 583.65 TaxID=1036611 RepID=A0A1L9PN89_ASPVE|nr:uncharacterized protein ASPVEDRAFT_84465 [Aspergillus versicolor CBS 583.65]OJJ02999.1 hypothetical protein ASPVEDRAFT_84465 [Aspergillus versicolor CBS 583.65]